MSDRLIDRWVTGTASAEDRAELAELIEKDPALVEKLFRAAERECDLSEMFRGLTPINSNAPIPTQRIARRRAARTIPWFQLAGGLAAALVIALILLQFGGPRTTHSEQAPAPIAKAPTTPAAAKPAPTPSAPVDVLPVPLAVDERTTLAEVFAEPVSDPVDTPSVPVRTPPRSTTTTKPKPPVMLAANDPTPVNNDRHIDRVDGELKDADGNLVMRYTLRAPRVTDSKGKLGLLLCFHGAGGNEKWLADPMLKALRTHGDVQFVVAALKSKGPNWERDDEANVVSFIDWAKRTYPIDARRIVIQGVSNGGWMVSNFGSRHPELIAGVVTLCGGNGFEAPVKRPSNAAETGFEYYIVHGTADEDVNVKHGRSISAALRANGFRYVYRELPGVGHNVWGDERTRSDFAGWLSRIRHKTMPLNDEDRKALAAFSRRDEAERLLLTDDGAAALVRIGGLPAEKILVRALRSRAPQVRATAAELFAHTATMPGATSLIAGLLNDKDPSVRASVIATLGRAADWNDHDALRALCRFAGMRGIAVAERLVVLDALTGSFSFRCSPSPDNQLIYETLVHLLEDDDLSLRRAAIAALPNVDQTRFSYDPTDSNADRREAVQKWQRWYLDLFTPADDKTEPRR